MNKPLSIGISTRNNEYMIHSNTLTRQELTMQGVVTNERGTLAYAR